MKKIIQDEMLKEMTTDIRDPLMQVLRESHQYDVRYKEVRARNLIDMNGHALLDFTSCPRPAPAAPP